MPASPPDDADRTAADVRVPRIVVTGSESTGKTTLAGWLAQSLATIWVPEHSRAYAERVNRSLTASDVEPIASGPLRDEEAGIAAWRARFAAQEAPPPLFLDTDLVSTTVFAGHYYGSCPAWIMSAARARLGDLYLLCATDVVWVADGVRDREDERAVLDAAFRARLRDVGADVEEVSGSSPQRLAQALAAVDRWARGG